jgi:hypothetical protein
VRRLFSRQRIGLLEQGAGAADNVEVRLNTWVVDGGGRGRLERLVLEDSVSNATETVRSAALFVLIGARPHTGCPRRSDTTRAATS